MDVPFSKRHRVLLTLAGLGLVAAAFLRLPVVVALDTDKGDSAIVGHFFFILSCLILGVQVIRARWLSGTVVALILYALFVIDSRYSAYQYFTRLGAKALALPFTIKLVIDLSGNVAIAGLILFVLVARRLQGPPKPKGIAKGIGVRR